MTQMGYKGSFSANGRGDLMEKPEDVAAMVRLHELGWGLRRIAGELGVSRNTVKRYVRQGGWAPYQTPERPGALDDLTAWIKERFLRHRGNAEVVRQELKGEHGIEVSLRTVERAVLPYRQELRAEARATVRFETPPGKQMQVDFGSKQAMIGEQKASIHVFVATLGYSRRIFVRPFAHERQSAWFDGMEGAFQHFGGVPQQVLLDNPKALVIRHDLETREVEFNERFRHFARHWNFRPVACAPYRARTKGKDERGVGYVKNNALAGHIFSSWAAMDAHLVRWMREVADIRVHGTTGERPIDRFQNEQLRPLSGRPPFQQIREVKRRVQSDACVEVDTNHYSVPWLLIGDDVVVQVEDAVVRIAHAGREVACHGESQGQRQYVVDRQHLAGIVGSASLTNPQQEDFRDRLPPPKRHPELLRSLAEYEMAVGGGW